MTITARVARLLALLLLGVAVPLSAQQPDSLTLPALQRAAEAADPRHRELDLLAAQSRLRMQNLAAERLPAISGQAQGQYQSDVTTVPLGLAGVTVPQPPHDTYDAHASVREPLLDATLGARRADQRAQLAESQAQVRTSLYALRREVNDAYFTAALLGERLRLLESAIGDLAVRLTDATARLREGSSLPSDSAAIAATILLRRQDELDLLAARHAALMRLGALAGRSIGDSAALGLPELAAAVARARDSLGALQARPEYGRFARARDRLAAQRSLIAARAAPSVSAFGRAGYGRPGLNQLSRAFEGYWLAGVQVQWSPFTWGNDSRDREAIDMQRQIVDADEAAFRRSLERAIQPDLAAVDRSDSTLALDEQIVALREQIAREARIRFQEGVITAAEYLDRSSDLLDSRLNRSTHRIEQERTRARILTTLGLELR